MKIKPVKKYTPPAYPTITEAKQDARLLTTLPRRWGRNHHLATLLGTGLMLGAARGNDADAPQNAEAAAVLPRGGGEDADEKVVRAIPITRVAPMLEDALANDGRGGFGCMAISAPVFLSENEALDLIQAELEKAGLKLRDMVPVDGLQMPAAEREVVKIEGNDWREMFKPRMINLEAGTYMFDLGTADKSVVVKFLQKKDYEQWLAETGSHSSYESFNLSWLATQVAGAFRQRETGDPVVIGLFFEPSTYPLMQLDLRGLDDEQKFLARKQSGNLWQTRNDESWQARHDATKERGREKLRAQVSHFVEYLKQEGVVE